MRDMENSSLHVEYIKCTKAPLSFSPHILFVFQLTISEGSYLAKQYSFNHCLTILGFGNYMMSSY